MLLLQAAPGPEDADSLSKRVRSVVLKAARAPSPELGTVVRQLREGLAANDASTVKQALGQAYNMTKIVHRCGAAAEVEQPNS